MPGLTLADNFKRAGRQAPATAGTILRGFVDSLFSVAIDLEGIKFFRTGGNTAAAAAASFRLCNCRRTGERV